MFHNFNEVEYTEELLEQREAELEKLREFYNANEDILGKVDECNKLWKQFLAMDQTTNGLPSTVTFLPACPSSVLLPYHYNYLLCCIPCF